MEEQTMTPAEILYSLAAVIAGYALFGVTRRHWSTGKAVAVIITLVVAVFATIAFTLYLFKPAWGFDNAPPSTRGTVPDKPCEVAFLVTSGDVTAFPAHWCEAPLYFRVTQTAIEIKGAGDSIRVLRLPSGWGLATGTRTVAYVVGEDTYVIDGVAHPVAVKKESPHAPKKTA
jgi:hypothetical protein